MVLQMKNILTYAYSRKSADTNVTGENGVGLMQAIPALARGALLMTIDANDRIEIGVLPDSQEMGGSEQCTWTKDSEKIKNKSKKQKKRKAHFMACEALLTKHWPKVFPKGRERLKERCNQLINAKNETVLGGRNSSGQLGQKGAKCFFTLVLLGCYDSVSVEKHIRAALPTLYLHYMPITWYLSVNNKAPVAIQCFWWTHNLVEMAKYAIYKPGDPAKIPIFVYVGFDHRGMPKKKTKGGTNDHIQSKGSVYVYCSGRLIETSEDTRTTLGLSSTGSTYQSGVTVIFDERRKTGKLFQPNPSKEHVQELRRSLLLFPGLQKFVMGYWAYWHKSFHHFEKQHAKMRQFIWKAGNKIAEFSNPATWRTRDIRNFNLSRFPPLLTSTGVWKKNLDEKYEHGMDVGKRLHKRPKKPIAKLKTKPARKKRKVWESSSSSSEEETSSESDSIQSSEDDEQLPAGSFNAARSTSNGGAAAAKQILKRKKRASKDIAIARNYEDEIRKLKEENQQLIKKHEEEKNEENRLYTLQFRNLRGKIYDLITQNNSLKLEVKIGKRIEKNIKKKFKRNSEHIADFINEAIEMEDAEDVEEVKTLARRLKEKAEAAERKERNERGLASWESQPSTSTTLSPRREILSPRREILSPMPEILSPVHSGFSDVDEDSFVRAGDGLASSSNSVT